MAATWRGAIEFAGFPVNVALHARTKSRSGESFKTLDPVHKQPVKSQYVDIDGNEVDRSRTLKGIAVGKDKWTALSAEAIEAIGAGERSSVVGASSFAPVDSIPLELATASFSVTADDKVPGAGSSTNLIWNGLRSTGLAYITQITLRAGSRDAILALWATPDGMWAATFPFKAEMHPDPVPEFQADPKAEVLFAQIIERDYEVTPFDFADYESDYRERRQSAIDAVLAGKEVAVPEKAAPKSGAPDLMAQLTATLAPTKAKAKLPAKKVPVAA